MKRRFWCVWLGIRYNPLWEWNHMRKLDKQGWRCKAGWLTGEGPDGDGHLLLLFLGAGREHVLCEYDEGTRKPRGSDREDLARWATCAVANVELVDDALCQAEYWQQFDRCDYPDELRRSGFVADKAVAVLTEAKSRLAVLEQ